MKIKKLVIPVAGLGTRFLPVTKSIPKEMLPIVDKPTIMILLEEAQLAGIKEVLFITTKRKECIKQFFEPSEIYKVKKIEDILKSIKISYVYQEKPLGSGDAILQAKEFVQNEPFAVMFGDDIIKGESALKELIQKYEETNSNIIGINKVDTKELSKYGIIEFKDDITKEINDIVEKPEISEAPSNYAGLGRYIFNPEIFECIKPDEKDCKLTDAMKLLMKKQQFFGCTFTGKYFDIGSKLGYIKANIEYGLENDEINDELKEYLRKISI